VEAQHYPGACHHYSSRATGGVLDGACHGDGGVRTRDHGRGTSRAGGEVDGCLADAVDARSAGADVATSALGVLAQCAAVKVGDELAVVQLYVLGLSRAGCEWVGRGELLVQRGVRKGDKAINCTMGNRFKQARARAAKRRTHLPGNAGCRSGHGERGVRDGVALVLSEVHCARGFRSVLTMLHWPGPVGVLEPLQTSHEIADFLHGLWWCFG